MNTITFIHRNAMGDIMFNLTKKKAENNEEAYTKQLMDELEKVY